MSGRWRSHFGRVEVALCRSGAQHVAFQADRLFLIGERGRQMILVLARADLFHAMVRRILIAESIEWHLIRIGGSILSGAKRDVL